MVVPTRNRARSLERLLESLRALELPHDVEVEFLVVNNASTDGTRELLEKQQKEWQKFPLKVVEEPGIGKARALNRALAEAVGDIIVFLDDDVVAHPAWLLGHVQAYRKTGFDALQGRVLPGVDSLGNAAHPACLFKYNIPIVDYGEWHREIRGLTGSNISFTRQVFEKVGGFDTRLGPRASGFSEDTEYSSRVRKAGFRIGYTPYAVVYQPRGRAARETKSLPESKGFGLSLSGSESRACRSFRTFLDSVHELPAFRALHRPQDRVQGVCKGREDHEVLGLSRGKHIKHAAST